uniref:Uncharacterized protein n=1 Tax=Arundo donax TaxID=35708 RepID=A0A0A9CSD7_ARUDO
MLGSNLPVVLTGKGSSLATGTALVHQNAAAGGAGILGACPVAMVLPSSPIQSASSMTPSLSGAAAGHGGLSTTAGAGASLMVPTTIGVNNSLSCLQVQGSGAAKSGRLSSLGTSTSTSPTSQVSTRPGLIQYYLGR